MATRDKVRGSGVRDRGSPRKMADGEKLQESPEGTPPDAQEGKKGVHSRRRRFVSHPVNYSDFNVHVVTWNVASALPSPHEIESLFLPQESLMLSDLYNTTDMVVVGLQEAYQKVQEAVSSSIPLVGKDPLVEAFSAFLSQKGFTRLSYSRMLGVLNMVFVKRPLLCYIKNVATCTTKTGFGGWVGNKGASSIRFTLGEIGICFTNCHLVPHPENNDKRVIELQDIFESQVFETARLPLTRLLDHDVLILFGDLNFRLEGKEFDDVVKVLEKHRYEDLMQFDQLRIEQIKGEESPSRLYNFMEMSIDFPPSYKYEPKTDTFDNGGKGRAPAWCDRILWRTHERQLPTLTDANPHSLMTQQYYGIHMQPRISDHKAVSAGLNLSVNISNIAPPIVFRLVEWVCGLQGAISFDIAANTVVSVWDWVGLYPSNFSCVDREYVYWIWTPASRGKVSREQVYSRALTPEQVPTVPGSYILIYKSSHYGRVLGMSPVFRIQPLQ